MRSLVAALAALLIFAAPVAAVPPPPVTASISIDQSPVSFGDAITFTTVVPKGTHNAWISVTCYQAGVLVYGEGGTADHTFVLGGASSQWVGNGGGPADCTADLGDLYWRGGHEYYTFLATTSFAAV